jgi:predicted NAD-dependent protein-ADP-ribosyltransferase YbiA (DUF1768 family)
MDEALFHKFTQHSDLLTELLGTGDAELIEVAPSMCFNCQLTNGLCRTLTRMHFGV